MKKRPIITAVLLVFFTAVGPTSIYAGSLDGAAKKADHGAEVAGQKVDQSTKAARESTDSAGKKAKHTTKTGADKVGGFFNKTSKTVEGWMKNLEKKVKK